eukprot:TRINITY_DN45085_c0_g1_i1.p1 TRINITY_DN45085_c0_g1~~TRINITY_DN45085_c0_g1_i1.p1  ORF type:complete len:289 (+),score=61.40 TRINITY_DN45085_c0_g1_i1:70-936(+)
MAAVLPDNLEGDEDPFGERVISFREGELKVTVYENFVEAGIGGVVTAASIELARFLVEEFPMAFWKDKACLELGCGCGCVSSALLQTGAKVAAAEQEAFVEHLRINIELNQAAAAQHLGEKPSFKCEALNWDDSTSRAALREKLLDGTREPETNYVVGANCLYGTEAVEPFFATLASVSNAHTEVLMCGVPQPKDCGIEGDTILDGFLHTALNTYDCFLLGSGGVQAPEKGTADAAASGKSFAAKIAVEHNTTVKTLADGVWLMRPKGFGTPGPDWPKPLVSLAGTDG